MFEDKDYTVGYIDKEEILSYVTQEDIYELVFGFKPQEGDMVCSPLRKDTQPGCWFAWYGDELRFKDFGSEIYINNKRWVNFNCFTVVQLYFNLPNFYQTLKFIKEKLILGKPLKYIPKKVTKSVSKFETKIEYLSRPFSLKDMHYWKSYGISSDNLIEDKVYAVKKYKITSLKGKNIFNAHSIAYAYTDFINNRVKLYFPYETGTKRFISNCKNNDIGNIKNLPLSGDSLIITKSYKDHRVLRNMGVENVVWFQSEKIFPNYDILYALCDRFKHITVFFDNDRTGMEEGKKLTEMINNMFIDKATQIWIPNHINNKSKDPADLYKHEGEECLKQVLKQNCLI